MDRGHHDQDGRRSTGVWPRKANHSTTSVRTPRRARDRPEPEPDPEVERKVREYCVSVGRRTQHGGLDAGDGWPTGRPLARLEFASMRTRPEGPGLRDG